MTIKHSLREQKICQWVAPVAFMMMVGFPGGATGQESTYQSRKCKRCEFDPHVGKIPWSRKRHPTPVFLRGKLHGQRSLVGYHPWGHKELDMTEHTHTHTHIIIVARGVPHTSVGKESTCNAEDLFDSCVRKIPWRRKQQSTPVFLPAEFHGQKRLAGYSPLGHKSWT